MYNDTGFRALQMCMRELGASRRKEIVSSLASHAINLGASTGIDKNSLERSHHGLSHLVIFGAQLVGDPELCRSFQRRNFLHTRVS